MPPHLFLPPSGGRAYIILLPDRQGIRCGRNDGSAFLRNTLKFGGSDCTVFKCEAFLRFFCASNVFFCSSTIFSAMPARYSSIVFRFSAWRAISSPPVVNRRVNERQIPRSKALMAAMNRARHFFQKHASEADPAGLVLETKAVPSARLGSAAKSQIIYTASGQGSNPNAVAGLLS